MSQTKPAAGVWNRVRRLAIVRIVLGIVIVALVLTVLQFGFREVAAASPAAKRFLDVAHLPEWVGVVAVLVTYWLFVRWIEKRKPVELGSSGAFGKAALGVCLGVLMFAATVGILALIGVYHANGFNPWSVLIGATAGATFSAVFEEILFRGLIFRITEESLGSWIALVISALLFGAVHLLNPHTSLQGGAAIVLEAGIFLAAGYMMTRRLWFVMGAHFGWNFTESGIFGAAVSGNASRGLIKSTITGPDYLSGGVFGVEASTVAIVICLTVAVVLLWRVWVKGGFVAPFWRRRHE